MLKIECEYDKKEKGANCQISIEGYSDTLAVEVASMLLSVRSAVNDQHPKMKDAGDILISEAFSLYLDLLGKGGQSYNAKGKLNKK